MSLHQFRYQYYYCLLIYKTTQILQLDLSRPCGEIRVVAEKDLEKGIHLKSKLFCAWKPILETQKDRARSKGQSIQIGFLRQVFWKMFHHRTHCTLQRILFSVHGKQDKYIYKAIIEIVLCTHINLWINYFACLKPQNFLHRIIQRTFDVILWDKRRISTFIIEIIWKNWWWDEMICQNILYNPAVILR